jgi:hypothetical protein
MHLQRASEISYRQREHSSRHLASIFCTSPDSLRRPLFHSVRARIKGREAGNRYVPLENAKFIAKQRHISGCWLLYIFAFDWTPGRDIFIC